MQLELDELHRQLSIRGKNGIPFICSACTLWILFTIIYALPMKIELKNIWLLICTGGMFPLSILYSMWMKSDWKMEGHPLSKLGLIFNLAQFVYFPLVFWALLRQPEEMIMFFAIITGAHFFPYSWYYQTKAYSVIAILSAVIIFIVGLIIKPVQMWFIPFIMVILLIILIGWLASDYKTKKFVN